MLWSANDNVPTHQLGRPGHRPRVPEVGWKHLTACMHHQTLPEGSRLEAHHRLHPRVHPGPAPLYRPREGAAPHRYGSASTSGMPSITSPFATPWASNQPWVISRACLAGYSDEVRLVS